MAEPERRFVLAGEVGDGVDAFALDRAASHYVTHVHRLRAGASVEALERGGRLLAGTLVWRDGEAWLTDVRSARSSAPSAPVVVAAGVLKPARWEWLIEKSVELGATEIAPFLADRAVAKIPEEKREGRRERWQRIADGAARQCGRSDLVTVATPTSLEAVIARHAEASLWQADEATPAEAWPSAGMDAATVVFFGPEGGFTDRERALLRDAGAVPFGLGPTMLRAETAVVCALSGIRLRHAGLL